MLLFLIILVQLVYFSILVLELVIAKNVQIRDVKWLQRLGPKKNESYPWQFHTDVLRWHSDGI